MNVLEARRRLLGAGVYKKTVTGNPAIAQGSLARMYPGIEMQGWTEQAQYEGNQLFDASSVVDGIISNGEVVENGSFATSDFISVIAGNVYSRSTTGASGNFFYNADKTYLQNVAGTVNIEAPEGAAYVRFCINKNDFDIQDIMLNAGSEALPWEPYTGGAPSPSPDYPQEIVSAGNYDEASGKYKVDVTLGGKNLFDESIVSDLSQGGATLTNNGDGSFTITGTGELAANFANTMYISGDEARKFLKTGTLYSNQTGKVPQFYVYAADSNRNILFTTSRNGECEITEDMLGKINRFCYAFYSVKGRTITPGVVWPMVWQYGDGTYEPYKPPQTVTLTSDRPLTKWDKLIKKAGVWGWEYGSAEIVFDGSDDEGWTYSGQRLGFAQAYVNLPNAYIFTSSELSVLLCNKFSVFGGNEWVKPTKVCMNIGFSAHAGRIGINIEDITINDNETLRIWLSENPMTVCYETSTETFTPLSASEQELMNALYTYRPTTVLSNQQGCQMALTYKTRKGVGGGVIF